MLSKQWGSVLVDLYLKRFFKIVFMFQAAKWGNWLTAGWCAAGGHPPDKQSDSHWDLRAAKEQWTDQDQARLCYRGQVYRQSDSEGILWWIKYLLDHL